jgi:hypothetical protein
MLPYHKIANKFDLKVFFPERMSKKGITWERINN